MRDIFETGRTGQKVFVFMRAYIFSVEGIVLKRTPNNHELSLLAF